MGAFQQAHHAGFSYPRMNLQPHLAQFASHNAGCPVFFET